MAASQGTETTTRRGGKFEGDQSGMIELYTAFHGVAVLTHADIGRSRPPTQGPDIGVISAETSGDAERAEMVD
jgi:hypothetical protein